MVMSPLVCNLKKILQGHQPCTSDRDPAQQRSGSVKILLGQAPRSRPTRSNTHSSSGIDAYRERILVQQRILPPSVRGGHWQQYGPKLRVPFCRICRKTNRSTVHWYAATQMIHRRCGTRHRVL